MSLTPLAAPEEGGWDIEETASGEEDETAEVDEGSPGPTTPDAPVGGSNGRGPTTDTGAGGTEEGAPEESVDPPGPYPVHRFPRSRSHTPYPSSTRDPAVGPREKGHGPERREVTGGSVGGDSVLGGLGHYGLCPL